MSPIKIIGITWLLVLFSAGLCSSSFAEEYYGEFNDSGDIQRWQSLNVDSSYIEGGSLVLKSSGSPRLISPGNLRITQSESVLSLRVKSSNDADATLIFQTGGGAIILKKFRLYPGDYSEYLVYVGDVIPKDDYVVALGLDFARNASVSVDYIRAIDPSFLQSFAAVWEGFWEPDRITVRTVNFVTTPALGRSSFLVPLYVLTGLLSILFFIYYLRKKNTPRQSVAKGVTLAFFAAAFLFAMRMDYNWLYIWSDDIRALSGKTETQKLEALYADRQEMDGFFGFIALIKSSVPEGAKIRPAVRPPHDPLAIVAKYYLLPLKTSAKAGYLWVYEGDNASFDPAQGVLRRGDDIELRRLRLLKAFNAGAAVYEDLGVK